MVPWLMSFARHSRAMRWLVVAIVLVAVLAACVATAFATSSRASQSPSLAPANAAQASTIWTSADLDDNDPLGRPRSQNNQLQVLQKRHFTIGYDNSRREPVWVSYHLSGPIRFHDAERRPNRFAPDPDVAAPAHHEDYTRSGYDRGHLAPAYAMLSRFGPEGLEETFVTSNIIPQRHALNAGAWEYLEERIAGREGSGGGWADEFGEVWVTDGPIVAHSMETLPGGEPIPTACWMIVLRHRSSRWDSLAFELPNAPVHDSAVKYLVSIRQIESDAGLDFDSALPSDEQDALEAMPAVALW